MKIETRRRRRTANDLSIKRTIRHRARTSAPARRTSRQTETTRDDGHFSRLQQARVSKTFAKSEALIDDNLYGRLFKYTYRGGVREYGRLMNKTRLVITFPRLLIRRTAFKTNSRTL